MKRKSILFAAFQAAVGALSFAAEQQHITKGDVGTLEVGNGSTAKATRKVIEPTVDVASLSEEEARSMLARLLASRSSLRDSTKTIRFNDGTESTLEWEDEAKTKPKMDPKTGRQVGSARNSGTISIYGFGRNPISLYPNQWLDLLLFGQDIAEFIAAKEGAINAYLTRRQGEKAQLVNVDAVIQLQEMYHRAEFGDAEPVPAKSVGVAAGVSGSATEDTGVTHTVDIEDDEESGEAE